MGDENLKSLGIVIRALRSLTEIQGPTPQQILNYISTQYSIPKEKIKRQLGTILKRCKEFGILKKTYGHQKICPKKLLPVTEKRPCCDCKDCRGNCGYCKPTDDNNGEKKGEKEKQKMCRSSKPKRHSLKKKKKMRSLSKKKKKKTKRDACRQKKIKKKKCIKKKPKRRLSKKC